MSFLSLEKRVAVRLFPRPEFFRTPPPRFYRTFVYCSATPYSAWRWFANCRRRFFLQKGPGRDPCPFFNEYLLARGTSRHFELGRWTSKALTLGRDPRCLGRGPVRSRSGSYPALWWSACRAGLIDFFPLCHGRSFCYRRHAVPRDAWPPPQDLDM